MKILIYSYNFLPMDSGGMESYLLSLIQRIKSRFEVILVLPRKHNISIKDVKVFNIPDLNFKFSTYGKIKTILFGSLKTIYDFLSIIIRFPLILIRNNINIVSVFNPSHYSSLILLISKLFRITTIINLRGTNIQNSYLKQLSLDSTFFFSNYIFMNSRDLFNRYKKLSKLPSFILSNKKAYFIPNGINTKFWKPDKTLQIKKKYDLVFVGNLTDRNHIINKGIKVLYEALKILRLDRGITLKVLIIGKFNEKLLQKMIATDFDEFADFFGYIAEKDMLRKKIQEAKIYVLPSISEGMPNSLMEAMALEMPCIASNVGAIPELIENDMNGLLFESMESNELATLIFLLYSNSELQKRIGVNAREKMIEIYEWSRVIKNVENYYKRFANWKYSSKIKSD